MADITLEPAPFRIRAWRGGQLVVDTREAKLARGLQPFVVWMFPTAAVQHLDTTGFVTHDGHVAVPWGAADEWWEEDEPVLGGHPRDPRHRVDSRASSRHVVVRWKGTLVAESRRPVLVAETHLPLRYYLPRADVRFELLRRSDRETWCPYKGKAHYYDIRVGDDVHEGALWTYEQPLPDTATQISGTIGVWHEKLEVTVDGAPLPGLAATALSPEPP